MKTDVAKSRPECKSRKETTGRSQGTEGTAQSGPEQTSQRETTGGWSGICRITTSLYTSPSFFFLLLCLSCFLLKQAATQKDKPSDSAARNAPYLSPFFFKKKGVVKAAQAYDS